MEGRVRIWECSLEAVGQEESQAWQSGFILRMMGRSRDREEPWALVMVREAQRTAGS